MSNPIDRRQIERALCEKGFVCSGDGRDHRFYYFHYKGKKTIVKTKISTGTGYKQYDDNLFRLMCKGLQLNTIKQVRDLLECPLSESDYVSILMKRGCL